MKYRGPFTCVVVLALLSPIFADDWPQFRGPDRTGISKETGLKKTWPQGGPPLVWTYANAGLGYSHPAVVGDRLYCMGAREGTEYLYALDLRASEGQNVKELWAAKIGPMFQWKEPGNSWNVGPSATPTVDGERVYALGGLGELICVEAATGKEIWRKNLPKEMAAEVNPIGGGPENLGWGFTWSPLVEGDQLICQPGGPQGLLAALDKKAGAVIWRSAEVKDQATYASPVVADIGGVRQYVVMTNAGIVGFAVKDGKRLWYYERKPEYSDCVIDSPIVHDGHVYATAGFGLGCDLVKVAREGEKFTATKVYQNKDLKNQNGGVVLFDNHIYGYSNKGRGWVCQEFKTGKIVWASKKLGSGSIIAAQGDLYCFGEDDGVMALVEANTKEWKEKSTFELPQKSKNNKSNGKLWTHPVIANGKLFLRDQELLFCYNIKE